MFLALFGFIISSYTIGHVPENTSERRHVGGLIGWIISGTGTLVKDSYISLYTRI